MRVEIRSRRRGVRHFVFLFPKCSQIVYWGVCLLQLSLPFLDFFFSFNWSDWIGPVVDFDTDPTMVWWCFQTTAMGNGDIPEPNPVNGLIFWWWAHLSVLIWNVPFLEQKHVHESTDVVTSLTGTFPSLPEPILLLPLPLPLLLLLLVFHGSLRRRFWTMMTNTGRFIHPFLPLDFPILLKRESLFVFCNLTSTNNSCRYSDTIRSLKKETDFPFLFLMNKSIMNQNA